MQIESDGWSREEREMEAALRGLSPAAVGLDRGAVLYAAGAAAGRAAALRTLWAWKAAAGVGIVACAALGMMRGPRTWRDRGVVTRVNLGAGQAARVLPRPAAVSAPAGRVIDVNFSAPDGSPWAYRQLMNAVAARGMEAIPASPNGDAGDPHILRADGKPVLILNGRIAEGGSL